MMADEDPDVVEEQELRQKFWAMCQASDAKPAVIAHACAGALTNLIALHAPDLESALCILEYVAASMREDIAHVYTRQREQMQQGAAEGWRVQ